MNTQVRPSHYFKDKYATLERFISYFYQVDLLKKYGSGKVLFIGVGDGLVPNYLKGNRNLKLTTFDFDAELNPDVLGDVRNLQFGDGEFDTVAAFEVLEHIPFNDFSMTVGDISRIVKKSVVVSIPCRQTGFEFVLKFPFIRSLFKKNFFHLFLRIPTRFPGFKESGQHYWEVDSYDYKISRVREVFKAHFNILVETSPVLSQHHIFFVLGKKHDQH